MSEGFVPVLNGGEIVGAMFGERLDLRESIHNIGSKNSPIAILQTYRNFPITSRHPDLTGLIQLIP